MARQLQAEANGLIGNYSLNKSVSRRDWLVACGGVALLSETQATKPPLVLALDPTAHWYLGTMPAELIQSNGSNLNGIISSLNQYSAVVVAMDLACLDSQENLRSVTQSVRARDAKVYGVGLSPFDFEGEKKKRRAYQGLLQLQRQTDGYRLVRSAEAVEALGWDATWAAGQQHLADTIQRLVAELPNTH